jgi:hypothetical protein
MATVKLDDAHVGDEVEVRDLPPTTLARGYGWVRTYDEKRTLHVCRYPDREGWRVIEEGKVDLTV